MQQEQNLNAQIGLRLPRISAAVLLVFALAIFSSAARSQTSKHAQAKELFAKAQTMRQALEAEPRDNRTLAEYKKVVTAFRRVYLLTPSAPETTEALFAVAELYHDMGDSFDSIYYKSSVVTYKFLLAQYPTNKFRADALFSVGQIESDDLHQTADARDAFAEYVKRFPHTPQADEARKDLAELQNQESQPTEDEEAPAVQQAAVQTRSTKAAGATADDESADANENMAKPGQPSSVLDIRTWNADD